MAIDVEQGPTSPDDQSVGDLVRDATTHLSTLIRSEIELARLELGASLRRFGWGVAFFGGAATVLFFSLFFPFIALAEGLVTLGLPRWGAYLVVWGVLLVLAVLLAFVGIRLVKRVRRPQRTLETMRGNASLARRSARREPGRDRNPDPDHGTDHGTDQGTGTASGTGETATKPADSPDSDAPPS